MAEPQIKNWKDVEDWLKGQPQAVSVALAHRAAMRAAPLWLGRERDGVPEPDQTDLMVLRCLLTSGLGVAVPGPEIRDAASAAFYDAAESELFGVAASAAGAAAAIAPADAVISAVHAVGSVSDWPSAEADAGLTGRGGDLMSAPLWQEMSPPFATEWGRALAHWRGSGQDWSFWISWYEAALAGRAQKVRLLTEIALIPNSDWYEGEEHLNGIIAGLRRVASSAKEEISS